MQEISIEDIDGVSGGNRLVSFLVGYVAGKVLDAGVSFVSNAVQNGGAQDFSRMTAMGDAY